MSEYQFYHFQTVDQPISQQQMRELRSISTRADITPTSFINTYNWGDLKANPRDLMRQYFDAFVYTANWGTHQLMFKIPRDLIDLDRAEAYCGEGCDIYVSQEHAILDFVYHDEDGYGYSYDEMEGDSSWMALLLPIRDAIMQGDLRALYLAWLSTVWEDDDTEEPPLPAGMNQLSGSLQAFARFMHIDAHLLEAAVQGDPQPSLAEPSEDEMIAWVATLPNADKDRILLELLTTPQTTAIVARLRQLFYQNRRQKNTLPQTGSNKRTAGQLWQAREVLAAAEKRRQQEQAKRERVERERRAAEQRRQYLDSLATQQASVWQQVTTLLKVSQQQNYDEAVRLLGDLRDLATDPEAMRQWQARIVEFRQRYARRPSLMRRFDRAGFPAHSPAS